MCWKIWQLVPANAVQMNVAPEYGLMSYEHSGSLISRETHASARPSTISVVVLMKLRRLKGELLKAYFRIVSLLIATRSHVPFLHHKHK
jgi:hypothetical protein